MIVIVDYGMGNLRSLSNALDFLGEDAEVSRDPADFAAADRIILPGVGAFGDAMVAIRSLGLEEPLTHQALVEKKPVLGICLGMQLMAKASDEHGAHTGLGWVDATVQHMIPTPEAKVPHVGWNQLTVRGYEWLFDGIPEQGNDVYFVHSLHMVCENPNSVIATCNHGGEITAAVSNGNVIGAQFHPEKSQDNGLQMLQNWLEHDF